MNSTACEESFAGRDLPTASSPRSIAAVAISAAKRATTFPVLLAGVLVARVFWACRDRIAEPDIWWHLVNAKYIVSTRSFPNVDTHCFTTIGMPWIDHAWLSELIFYGAYSAFGLVGLYFAFSLCLAVIVVLVYRMCIREGSDPFAAGVASMVGAVLAMVGFGPRTHIFGWLCFTAMFAILLQFRSKRHAPLWALPLIFCVWVNLHASWMFGIVVFAMIVLAGLIRRNIGHLAADPWSSVELKKLAAVGGLSIAALFVNPYGYRMLMFPFNVLFRLPLSVGYTQEFAPINFADSRGMIVAAVMCAVFVLAFTARKQWRIHEALLVIFAMYCGLTHIRFLFLTGIVLPPILAAKLGEISSYDGIRERRVLNGTLLAITMAVLVIGIPSVKALDREISEYFPVRALAYLETHKPAGRVFHPDNWGGYMQWHLPQAQTFIDTRADIFEYKGVTRDYLKIVLVAESPEKLLESYQISDVLFPADSALARYLSNAPHWERVYGDGQAVIYRRIPTQPSSGFKSKSIDGSETGDLSFAGVVSNLQVDKRSSVDSRDSKD